MSWSMMRIRKYRDSERGDRRAVMTPTERAVIEACAEVLLPQGGAIPLSGIDAGVVPYFDDVLARVPTTTRMLLRALIHFVEVSPWVYGPFKARMSRLAPEHRAKVLRALMDSRLYLLRTAFLGLRTVLTIAYFGSEEVNRSIGATPDLNPFDLSEEAAA